MAMFPPSQTRAMWPVIVVSMAVTLVASELALGAIRNYQDEVSDRLYVMVFAAASLSALVVCFFASEVLRNLLSRLKWSRPDQEQ